MIPRPDSEEVDSAADLLARNSHCSAAASRLTEPTVIMRDAFATNAHGRASRR